MNADAFFQRLWYERRPRGLSTLLLPLSAVFGSVAALRRRAYRTGKRASIDVGKPVIVVGNISVGGTGKTPVVLWLARKLEDAGLRVGIVSRGYRGAATRWPQAVKPDSDARSVGDEPVLLARRSAAIVVAGPDRVAAAKRAVEQGVDVIISDDGLQHYPLMRSCEIAVVDAWRGFGNGRLLPAGPLREAPERLGSVDAVLLRQTAGVPHVTRRLPTNALTVPFRVLATRVLSLATGEARTLESFTSTPVHAVAGIGHPEVFFATLRAAGLHVDSRTLPDHAALTPADLKFGDSHPVLMTEKDAVKCPGDPDPRWWVVLADASFDDADAELLVALVERKTRLTLSSRTV